MTCEEDYPLPSWVRDLHTPKFDSKASKALWHVLQSAGARPEMAVDSWRLAWQALASQSGGFMRLVRLKLENYRRFAGAHSLDLNEDLIALVGPNEAGKSSILHALELLGTDKHPEMSDATRPGQGVTATVSGMFVLDQTDRALLGEIHNGGLVTHVWVHLKAGETHQRWTISRYPERDLGLRVDSKRLLAMVEGDPALSGESSVTPEVQWDQMLFEKTITQLDSEKETLEREVVDSFKSLLVRLDNLKDPFDASGDGVDVEPGRSESENVAERRRTREVAAEALRRLIDVEQLPPPAVQVIQALKGRLPQIAFFRAQDRELQRDYQIDTVAGDPPPALKNLCALAELDLATVKIDRDSGRIPHLEKVFEEANKTLRRRFQETWSQSTVYPRLSTPLDGVLRIFVATEGEVTYSLPEERSDGLRWFIALQAFLVAHRAKVPILLVDEAETHLHYDGQADLIDALMRQRITSKVVYSTHSVGCLPPDLGCGIRVVLAEKEAERSRIGNSYWSVDPAPELRIGYAPLLFAMGSRLLSLTIPRYGVVAEGPSDAVLLPSLLREAAGINALPYRVVAGLSELAKEDVWRLQEQAGKVICLTDGDDNGDELRRRLTQGGMPAAAVFSLGMIVPGCTLEDLVRRDLFAAAVNGEIEMWELGSLRLEPDHVPAVGRWRWLENEGTRTDTPIERLSKVRVAQRVVDLGRSVDETAPPAARLDAVHRDGLKALHEKLVAALRIGGG